MTQQTKTKQKNRKNIILTGAVVVLAAALIFETAYLVTLQTSQPEAKIQPGREAGDSLFGDPAALPSGERLRAVPWDPFVELDRMQDRMNRLFHESFRRVNSFMGSGSSVMPVFFEPELDVREHPDHYVMTFDLPGMEKDEIRIEVTDRALTVSGERQSQMTEEEDSGLGYYRMERRFGAFSRTVPIPKNASPDGVKADYEQGVLKITLPKLDEKDPRAGGKKIAIQ